MNKTAISLTLLLSLNTSPKVVADRNNHCYSDEDVEKLAEAVTGIKKCKIELLEKQRLIDEKLTLNPVEAGASWWQEPSFVWGGMAVSFSFGALLGWYIAESK